MPLRKKPLVTKETYHVLNRGSGSIPIFKHYHDYQRLTYAFRYYQYQNPPSKFSLFLLSSQAEREKTLTKLKQSGKLLVEILAYCLMPNHYHFLLRQLRDNGIVDFIRLTTGSYSKYFNIKYDRSGSLFGGRFQAVRVETEEQFLHLNRYIHLNPYSAFLVKSRQSLLSYPYSSLSEYLNTQKTNICQKKIIFSYFKTPQDYQKFILDRADYQRNLELIKHQMLEK